MVLPDRRGSSKLTRGAGSAIVSVGNELLFGETTDTNAAWLGRRLTAIGLPVLRRFTVPDVDSEIQDAVRAAMRYAPLVLVSGGLGPTDDDRTRNAVAQMFGRTLTMDDAVTEHIDARFRSAGLAGMPAPSRSVALVPQGGRVLMNEWGTAPGLVLDEDTSVVVLLPGVPRELRGLFDYGVVPFIEERFHGRITPMIHSSLHTTGIPESRLYEMVQGILPGNGSALSVAFLPDLRGVEVRVSSPETLTQAREALVAELGELMAPWLFEAASGDVTEALIERLRAAGLRLATAESCTGGLMMKRLTDVAGVSDVTVGGIIAYANSVKIEELGVSASDIDEFGAVSEEVARAMSRGVTTRLRSDIGIAVTGIAGPGGGSDEKPVGTVWISVHGPDGTVARSFLFPGDRGEVRERAAQEGLAMAFRSLDPSTGRG